MHEKIIVYIYTHTIYTYIHNTRQYLIQSTPVSTCLVLPMCSSSQMSSGQACKCFLLRLLRNKDFFHTQTDFCFSSQLYDSFPQLLWNSVQRHHNRCQRCGNFKILLTAANIYLLLIFCDVARCNCFLICIALSPYCTYMPLGVHYPHFVYYSLVFEWHIWNVRRLKVISLGCFRAHRLPFLLTTVTACGSSSTSYVCDRRSG